MKPLYPDCETCSCKRDSIFTHCALEELHSISSNKSCTIYKRGQAIFQEGNKPFGVYCLNEGKVKITKLGSEGKEQIVRLGKPGDTLGYRALLSDTRYSASAIALEDTKVCFIASEDFNQLIAKNYLVAKDMMRMLSNALADAEVSIAQLATKPVRERLAEALLLLKKVYGKQDEEFSIALSREDLASLVGTAKETAIRFLSELKDEGVVSTQGSIITILKPDALVRISQMYD
jgi:CRP/FNR family transcriptional regulator, polysaccharide utilization system transcription regulator